jgi:hypothetical protein
MLGGAGAFVTLLVVVLVVALSGGGKGSTPEETAEAFADAFNDRDADDIKALMCDSHLQEVEERERTGTFDRAAFEGVPEEAMIEVERIEMRGEGEAIAHFTATVDEGTPAAIPLVKNVDDEWEVCYE